MNFGTLIVRSLRFHARSHIGTLLGATIGSAILIGALAVGDSVRESLRQMALARLGKTEFALASTDRFFRARLAEDINSANFRTAAALQIFGTASNEEDSSRANHVQILGVSGDFWKLANRDPNLLLTDETIALNESLAVQLNVKVGETILLRVPKPSPLSRDAPISPQQDSSTAFRLTVTAVLSATDLGNFNLRASQNPPQNAFMSLGFLQNKLGLNGKANLLLSGSVSNQPATIGDLEKSLREKWQLADAELELKQLTNQNVLELRTSRVFLDPPIVRTVVNSTTQANLVSTYFVNELRAGELMTPYSMVSAVGAPIVPRNMRDKEIIVNRWLADDLRLEQEDEVEMHYFVMGTDQRLEEKTNFFRVRAIVPLAGFYADRDLMPEFPGVAKAEKTEEWDAGFAIDTKKIRTIDEQYWKDFRGTPKAFVTLAAAEKMWSNRFGTFTAIRFPISETAKVQENLRRNLDPASLGLVFQPVREQALAASSQSQDFGQLFLGFSFFLIFAALILVGLLFQFGLEQRATEIGTLLALGFQPKQIRRLLLGEGIALASLGGILGMLGGIYYAKGMLLGLNTLWRDAVGTSSLQFHITLLTTAIGCAASLFISIFTIWLSLRNQAKRPAHELLSQGAELELTANELASNKRCFAHWIALTSFLTAIGLVFWASSKRDMSNAGIFFGAGTLLLISGLSFAWYFLKRLGRIVSEKQLSVAGLGIRSCSRRRKRSLATIGLLACGSFLVVAVAANKLDANQNSKLRSSGTGGFALIGESTLPVTKNMNDKSGREFFGLDENELKDASFIPFRVREGDEASCLNLNRAQTPRLLGVNPDLLVGRFSFVNFAEDLWPYSPWPSLKLGNGTVPISNTNEIAAIGDANSIQWALHKKVGDIIPYTDERGNKFNVRIVAAVANSILQGSLIIDEAEFVKRFPSTSGYRMFLIDAPSENVEQVSATLSRAFRDAGLELTKSESRLAAFNAVQNTYLNTFQILGGLGLLLGSAGMGIVVLRNVLERRSELAVLLAIGFRKKSLRWLVLSEHAALLWIGVSLGIFAAFAAVLPALLSPRGDLPYVSLAVTLGAVLVSGMIWTWAATSLALRGELLDSLRNN